MFVFLIQKRENLYSLRMILRDMLLLIINAIMPQKFNLSINQCFLPNLFCCKVFLKKVHSSIAATNSTLYVA